MATCWAKCSDLFLYTKGKDVYLWRCNETTLMPMKTADFDDLGKVMDHLDLVGGRDAVFDWEESSYIDLVAYISSRRLLVNSRGLVIAELHEFDQDGKMEENGLPPFYIRSLDVLSLKHFGLRDRNIPSRTVLYLETEGKAAPVEDSTTTTTTSSSTELDEGKRRADLEKQVTELKAAVIKLTEANKTLKSDKEALKSDKEAAEKQANDLKDRNKSLAEDVAAQKTAAETKAADLQTQIDSGKQAAEKEATELKEENKTLRSGKEASDKQVKDLQDHIKSYINKPVWMRDIYVPKDGDMNHVKVSALGERSFVFTLVGSLGDSYLIETDDSSNVKGNYMYEFTSINFGRVYTWWGVDIDSLPKKEMARFKKNVWYMATSNGRKYVVRLGR